MKVRSSLKSLNRKTVLLSSGGAVVPSW